MESIQLIAPAGPPNGRHMVFTGLVEGQSDLFLLELKTGKVTQLTNDPASDIQPDWSRDGNKILFATDRLSLEHRNQGGMWRFNLAELDINTGEIFNLDIFPSADNLNPTYDKDENIWFLSDRDGYRNIYKYVPQSEELFQMTNVLSGISEITSYAPAFSVSKRRDLVLFSHYYGGDYDIYAATERAFLNTPVDHYDVDFTAATLPVADVL